MKTFTVKQLAEMLDTNPETVRRWIREKKLNSVQVSRKTGNVVSEEELNKFLKKTPKYVGMISGMAVASPMIAIPALAALITGSVVLDHKQKESLYTTNILPEDAKRYIRKMIKQNETSISNKEKAIGQLNQEISYHKRQNDEYQKVLVSLEQYEEEKED